MFASLENRVFGAGLTHHKVRYHYQREPYHRLQEARRRGPPDAAGAHQRPVDVGVDGVGHRVERAGVLRHLVEQAEVRVEDAPDIHDKKGNDGRHQAGQGNLGDLLPLAGSVQLRRLIEALVDTGNGRNVNQCAVAHALPAVGDNEDQRPPGGVIVPLHGI